MITAVSTLLCLLHVLSLAKGDCDTNPFTRSPCDLLKPIPDRLTCENRNCCFDDSPFIGRNARCYKKGLSLGSARFKPSVAPERHNEPSQLTIGGRNGYPGSILRRSCSKAASLCSTSASYNSKASCTRMSCCFIDGACYKAIFNVIHLRDKCEPGYANPPQCKEINECEANPCIKNREVCIDKVNNYECQCPVGETCEQNCDSIPTGATYDVAYNTDNVIYPDPVPSGKQLPRTTATITCKPDMYFPYSFTNTLTVETTLTFTCSSGTFGATAPVCKKRCDAPALTYGSINYPIAGLEMVLEGQSISYSCDNGFSMDAMADNLLECQSDGTLSGTLASKSIQCSSIYEHHAMNGQAKSWTDAQSDCLTTYNGKLIQLDPRLETLEGRKEIYDDLVWQSPPTNGGFWTGIERDPADSSYVTDWRRSSDQAAFSISPADWWPGFPKAKEQKSHVMVRFVPANADHGKFRNKNPDAEMSFICEALK